MSSRAIRKLQNDEELLASLLASNKAPSRNEKTQQQSKQVNLFALMDDDESSYESEDAVEVPASEGMKSHEKVVASSANDEGEVRKVVLQTKSQKRRNKKNKKKKGKNSCVPKNNDEDTFNDDDLDKLLQHFQKRDIKDFGLNVTNVNHSDEFFTASESDNGSDDEISSTDIIENDLLDDTYFSKFPIHTIKYAKRFFNTDFKKLDPHQEFKLLFDDISAESLEDIDSMSSTSISPQQLKQIQKMKRLVRNWGGKDHRNVPNGPGGSVHRLQFTKVRDDWLPTPRGELNMRLLTSDELMDWQLWQRPLDWKDVIEQDLKSWQKYVTFYKFEPLNPDSNKAAMTEFYMSVILHPDHEALISLIASKFPYHVPGLLQVALITIRQGDKSNTNGLLQRALFVFDRALKSNVKFDGTSFQLPYIYFFNRQFYLTIFRYILSLAQRGAFATAGEWCKVLWSLSPLEDPLGCRYFLDHYLLLNSEYRYIIDLSKSSLANTYRQWYTLGLALGTVLSYLKIEETELAKLELMKCFKHHPLAIAMLFIDKLAGDRCLVGGLDISASPAEQIECKAYLARFSLLWKGHEEIKFLYDEISKILSDYQNNKIELSFLMGSVDEESEHPFFIKGIPVNLLRFVVLSEESSVMASIPSYVWSDYEVFEFDVLPPLARDRESLEVIETVKSFVNDRDLATNQAVRMQDDQLLAQIRQLSLDQYLQENPNAAPEI
ncbi:hypothetical protein KAFR_0D04340 [Kazachstania africana CBS 2517]|uniref:Ribosome quality control complex subunit 1 n=1 Tax=Kazachstania africana (strain ATCC 22294 / BCRC 22015 / CBS 2517 / CECT 1963 / NBRC 1671 / NRRL Y-8276) TaxID=1071382 RepID=H2AUN2_KAZAF|nr:hypothetical protein KAFR_0D04340 [Kazachstania africana CBS 2517]CCF58082.1 hypothetical protein KAFR_0D04340 [Kazachstania africana CBS 2517]